MSLLAHLSKDARLMLRDRQALLVGLVLPALILVVFDQLDLGAWVRATDRDPEAFILILAVTFPALLLASTSLLSERRQGTLARVARSPADPLGVVVSKSLTTMGLLAVQVAILVAVGRLTLSPEATQAPWDLALLLITAAATAHALGLVISAVARTEGQALQATALVFLVMLTLSGFLRPLDGIGTVGEVASFLPMALGYNGTFLLFGGQPEASYVLTLAVGYLLLLTVAHIVLRLRA